MKTSVESIHAPDVTIKRPYVLSIISWDHDMLPTETDGESEFVFSMTSKELKVLLGQICDELGVEVS